MRKWLYSTCMLLMLALFLFPLAIILSSPALAAGTIELMVEGKSVHPDVPPQIVDQRTFVPLRVISENLQAGVIWFPETKTIRITKQGRTVEFVLDSTKVRVNGQEKTIDVAPFTESSRTLVPLRFVGEFLGVNVGWDEKKKTVIVSEPIRLTFSGQAVPSGGKTFLIDRVPYVPLAQVADVFGYELEKKDDLTVALRSAHNKTSSTVTKAGTNDSRTAAKSIVLTAWSKRVEKDGQAVHIDYEPRKIDGVFMVSLSFVEQMLGGQAEWKPAEREIALKPGNPVQDEPSAAPAKPQVPAGTNVVESISLNGNDVIIEGDAPHRLQGKVFTLESPDRLVIDIPSAILADTLKAEREGVLSYEHPLVRSIRYSHYNDSPHMVRVVVDLKQKVRYQWKNEDGGRFVVSLAPVGKKALTVVIDAGHGAHDPGALGKMSKEKDINLAIAKKIVSRLEQLEGIEVVPTRLTDTFLTLEERVKLANERSADLFISVHANSFPANPQAKGLETYYYTSMSKKFAEIVHRHLIEATGSYDRGVKTARFYVIRNTKMPAVLIETGFVTNPEEEKRLNSAAFQEAIARAVVEAIKEYQSGM
ncbi:hypothetical protein BSNK01_05860 [Bacillaceae bacterium]